MPVDECLELCARILEAAEQFPHRTPEFMGSLVTIIETLKEKAVKNGYLSEWDSKYIREIELLTEKWVE